MWISPTYHNFECNNNVTKFFAILIKIKNELKIDSFDELTNCIEKLYIQITAETDIARKTLKLIVEMTTFSKKMRKKNKLSLLHINL